MPFIVRVLALTSEGISRAGRIRLSDEGDLYYEPDLPGAGDHHLSRHASGEVHWRSKKDRIMDEVVTRVPIAQVTYEQVLATGLDVTNIPAIFKPYVDQEADGIFAIDMRKLPAGHPNLFVWLVSPNHLQDLFDEHKNFPSVGPHQYYVFTGVEPWLVLTTVTIAPDPPS